MKKEFLFIVLVMLLLCGAACSRAIIPDSVLQGLHKPVLKSISPAAVQFNGAGFFLNVVTEYLEDDQYVLYINDRKIGQDVPEYWRTSLGWMLSKEWISEFLASSPNGVTCSVRISSINEDYDISGVFDKYRDYVSEPVVLEIKKGETQFSTAQQLFPEWTHSSDPIIRCDPQGNIYLAWREKVNGVYQAFFSFSADNGQTWSQVLNISRSSDSVDQIDLDADGAGHFYMTWQVRGNEESDVFFCRSLDHGATWHFPVRMDADGEFGRTPSLEVDDRGDVFLVWLRADDREDPDLRLAVSRDLGKNWSLKNFDVPRASYDWGMPLLAAQPGGPMYLFNGRYGNAYQFLDVFSSQDHGSTWRKQEVATGDIYPLQLYSLACFGSENQIYLAWGRSSYAGHQYSHWNWFLRRESSGDWGAIQDLKSICPCRGEKTALAASADGLDAVMTGFGCLFLLRSTDEGRNWPVPETVPGSEGFNISDSQDMVLHPSGKTYLVFVRKTTPMDGGLYLTSFD